MLWFLMSAAQPPAPLPPKKSPAKLIPNIVSTSSTLTFYSKTGQKEAEIRFDNQVAGDQGAFFTNPRGTFYTEKGQLQISAPHGKYENDAQMLTLEGGVSASHSDPVSSFGADAIRYNVESRILTGDGALDLTWQGLHISGKKFQMDITAKTFMLEKEAQVRLAAQS